MACEQIYEYGFKYSSKLVLTPGAILVNEYDQMH
jgi:hypothetical protein